jgi:sporulation protein YlmC with PRC-barrel domain
VPLADASQWSVAEELRERMMTGRPLIESDRVEGTYVYDHNDIHIGTIKRLMIEKVSGQVRSAVISFGGFFGLGEKEYSIPWAKLQYDVNLAGYRTDITEQDLKTGKYQ